MQKWRIIKTKKDRGAMQMAADEAVLLSRAANECRNTLRFYTWQPAAVTVGYFQSIKDEVDEKQAKKDGVDIIRRYTGGGAVFHDREITYSIAISEQEVSRDITKSYAQICAGVVKGLNQLGLKAVFSPINDILVNNKKISGSAQTRKMGVVLQHGTIILELNAPKMFSLLKVPDEKIKDKLIKSVSERVTSLKNELKKTYSEEAEEAVVDALANGFAQAFGIKLESEELSEKEKQMAKKLCREKYSSDNWNYWR